MLDKELHKISTKQSEVWPLLKIWAIKSPNFVAWPKIRSTHCHLQIQQGHLAVLCSTPHMDTQAHVSMRSSKWRAHLQWVFASQTVPHHPTTGHGEGCAPCCWWHALTIALLSGTDRGGRRSAAVMLYKVFLVLKSAAKRAVAACAACCSSTPLDRRNSLRAEESSNRLSDIVIESVAMYRCGSVPWPEIRPASQKQQL